MQLSRFFDGRKFMWDGAVYPESLAAEAAAQGYRGDGFEVETLAEDGGFYVFTRRPVREAATGSA